MQTENDMNTEESTRRDAPASGSAREGELTAEASTHVALPGFAERARGFLFQVACRALRGEQRSPSILRNNTNLPVFLVLALGLSLVCNFVLKESSAQASRWLGPAATLQEAQELVARNPEEPALHSHLGELYSQRRNYKRAMFHFREASRLSELYGE